MAVTNWVNYAGIPAQKPDFGLSDLVDNAYKGYEYSKLPAKLREEQAILEMKKALGWKKDAREEAKEARLSEAAKRKQDLLSLILGQNGDTATGASAPTGFPSRAERPIFLGHTICYLYR